ncbi:hypothetical protein LZQ00_11355 [Sphingobacterium sp. SRCM116780]|uniref:hypothetical protein n=1 Tax=Sphingobacterium sp. SRCM116780 TaxID=2907623 RepID=UPI001F394B0C|nr:hypothetical protein [Sphingobacterium sp. SRCM116780]UIR54875.1 hypothetical protein LZQ00_11355 [Sphingobacterium sp. SRCM116780]
MLQFITIHELVLAITIVFILVLLLIIIVLLYSVYKYRVLHNRQIWTHIIESKITSFIVEDQNFLDTDESFLNHLQVPAFRSLFLDLLVKSEQKFSGVAHEQITHIFQLFQLEDEAWRNLHKKKSYLIAGGIQELTAMRVERALPMFISLLAHPQQHVYQEAQYAIVSFKGFEGLNFLETLVQPLSDWQQLRLLRSITDIPNLQIFRIYSWLESSNASVTIFTLRLIRKFQLLSFYEAVLKLLNHSMLTVKIEVVRTLQALENIDTVNQLMGSFPHQPQSIQIEILKALKVSKNLQTEQFLKEQLWQHPANSIKIASAEVLVCLGQRQYLRDMAWEISTPAQFKQIINHALQEKIC